MRPTETSTKPILAVSDAIIKSHPKANSNPPPNAPPLIAATHGDVLGPNILCWSSNFFIKEANDNAFVSWHQDSGYWGLEPDDVVTAWLALSDANIKTGPMEVIPKSHKWNNLNHTETFNKNNLLSRGQELDIKLSNHDSVAMPLNAGEISLHHVKLAHSSKINTTQDRRIGIAIRYTTPEVKQTKALDYKDSALLDRSAYITGTAINVDGGMCPVF